MKLDYYAVITISNCRVHLDTTFNPCASEPIQIENYGHNGWYICQHCPLLKYAFWPTWCEWNGLAVGSIYLTDNQSIRAINKHVPASTFLLFAYTAHADWSTSVDIKTPRSDTAAELETVPAISYLRKLISLE